MYHYALFGYMLWRYSYILEYTYSALCYANYIRHFIKNKNNNINNDDWILVQPKEPHILLQEIEIPH